MTKQTDTGGVFTKDQLKAMARAATWSQIQVMYADELDVLKQQWQLEPRLVFQCNECSFVTYDRDEVEYHVENAHTESEAQLTQSNKESSNESN